MPPTAIASATPSDSAAWPMVCSAHVISSLSIEPSGAVGDAVEAVPTAGARCGGAASRPARTPTPVRRPGDGRPRAGSVRATVLQLVHRLEVARREAELGRFALVADDGHRQRPTFAGLADHVVGRHPGVVERDLAELGRDAVDHPQRPLLDARPAASARRTPRCPCAWARRDRCGRARCTTRRRRSSSSRSCGR